MVTRWSLFALGLVLVLGASPATAKRGKKRSKPAPAAAEAAPVEAAPAADPVIAILPVATKKRAKSKEKRQAKALHEAITEALGQLERAPQIVDGRKNAKEVARKQERGTKRLTATWKKAAKQTAATHLLDLKLDGKGKRAKLTAIVIDTKTFKPLGEATVKVGTEGRGAFIAELLGALDAHLPRVAPPPPPPEPEPEPVAEAAPSSDKTAKMATVEPASEAEDEGGGSIISWGLFGGSGLTGLVTVGALGSAVALGVLAYMDSTAYVQGATGGSDLRASSELKAMGADALYVGAAVAAVVTVGLVAGGVGVMLIE